MKSSKPLMIAVSLAVSGATAASAATPVQVVQHHVAMMKKGDLKAIMSDYAANAVVITPNGLVRGQTPASGAGVFSGIDNARRVFATLTDKDHHPGVVTMQTRIEPDGNDVALLHWTQFKGTPQQVTGEDVFVVRGNKILYQAILVDSAK
jgi:ketosteroid isomerase-like protein